MKKMNIKVDRLEIARIIEINMPLMQKNDFMIQNVADCIICYMIGALDENEKKK